MSDFNTEEDDERIPYDYEPIQRGHIRQENTQNINKSSKNPFYILLTLVLVLAVAIGTTVISFNKRISNLSLNKNDYNMNITSMGNASASAKGMLSSVCVSASNANNGGDYDYFLSGSMISRGSGVILEVNKATGDAYIITNYHVVANVNTETVYNYIWVLLWDSFSPVQVSYVGGSKTYDLAVLKVNASTEFMNSSCAGVTVKDSMSLCVAEEVYVIGNSMARNIRNSKGIVSVEEDMMGNSLYISFDAAVNSGNSGGGLFNANGELIGIVNAKFKDVTDSGNLIYNEMIQGMSYAIPSSIAVSIARNIIKYGELKRPSIGLVYNNSYSYSKNGKKYSITEDAKGFTTYNLEMIANAGVFKSGDKFVSLSYEFGGEIKHIEINRLQAIEGHMYYWTKDTNIEFVVIRSGIETTLTVKVNDFVTVK